MWPTISLAHYFQYVRNDIGRAKSLLLEALRLRNIGPLVFGRKGSVGASSCSGFRNGYDNTNFAKEVCALLTAIAYCYFDLQDDENTRKFANAALEVNAKYGDSMRCLGLLAWKDASNKRQAVLMINKSTKVSSPSPHCYRTASIISALEGNLFSLGQKATAMFTIYFHILTGNFKEAYRLMEHSVIQGPNYPLAWRALGIMSYLYNRTPDAIEFLSKGSVPSSHHNT